MLLVLLALAPVLGLLLYESAQKHGAAATAAQERVLMLAREVAAHQEELLAGARQLLFTLARLPDVRSNDPALSALFADILKQNPHFEEIVLVDLKGKPRAMAPPLPASINFTTDNWFQETVHTPDFTVGEYQADHSTGETELHVAYPVLDRAGQLQAVISVGMKLNSLDRMAVQSRLPEGSTITLTDRSATILARYPDPKKWVGKTFPEASIGRAILRDHGDGTAEMEDADGVARLYAFVPFGDIARGERVRVRCGIPTRVVYAEARQALVRSLMTLGLVALLAMLIAHTVSKAFLRKRVRPLLAATERLAAGDLGARTGMDGGLGELSQLAGSFDQMAATLQQRAAEREQLSRQNQLILNAAGEGIFGMDADGNVTFVNPAAAAMTGWTVEKLIGRPVHATVHHTKADGSAYPREECPNHATVKDGTCHQVDDEVFWRKDGTSFPVEYISSPIREGNEVVGAVVTFRDITARKQAAAALEEQLGRIGLLNDIARAVLSRNDLASIFRVVLQHLERNLSVDQGGVAFFDPDKDALTIGVHRTKNGKSGSQLIAPEGVVVPVDQIGMRACVQGETVYIPDTAKVDALILQQYARTGMRSLVAVPLIVEGKVFAILSVARRLPAGFHNAEIEFLKRLGDHVALAARQARLYQSLQQAYNDLRQTQQAIMQQERLRALGQMASGIAHDINNALSPILGYADMLLKGDTGLSDRARQFITTIRTAGGDIARIVGRMREFYRKREDQEVLLPVRLNPLVEQVIELTRPRWRDMTQERGVAIEMRTELQPALPVVMGIESEIREALTNLVFNAVDAMPDGGTLTIRTSSRDGTSAGVILEVTDTGTGMDEETRRRCVEPFYTTKGPRGTGLGLPMVYGIMQRHEGDIQIVSELGKGTTVRLLFPHREPAEPGVANAPTTMKLAPLRILCVDDDPALRQVVKEMLEGEGHTVVVADGGQAGVETFRAANARRQPFDVVITDMGMPYVNGREVARAVKAESAHVPVIVLTGWGTQARVREDRLANVDVVISKPPRLHELQAALVTVKTRRPVQASQR